MNRRSVARLDRQFDWIERRFPAISRPLAWIRRPALLPVRLPLSLLLIAGGVLSFLPILGIWMLPLGLLLLAVDLPPLRGPIAGLIIRLRRLAERKHRQHRDRRSRRGRQG